MAVSEFTSTTGPPPSGADPSRRVDGGGSPGIRVDLLILAGLLTLFVVAFVVLRQVPLVYDPIEYFITATRLDMVAPHHRSLRIGMLLPVRGAQELFGESQAAYYAFPLAMGATLMASTFALGRMLFDRRVAVVAALAVVFNPLVFGSVHMIWPDLPAAALFTAALAVLVAAGRRVRSEDVEVSVLVHGAFLAVGLLLGWAYLVREFTVVLFPVALLPFWLMRIPLRYLAGIVAGALAVLGFEFAYNAWRFGNPFVRIEDLLGVRSTPPAEHARDVIERRDQLRGTRVERVFTLPALIWNAPAGPVMAGLGLLALAAPFLRRTDRTVRILVLWLAFYWVTVTAMSLNTDEFGRALFTQKVRYWYPVLPPLFLAGVAGLFTLLDRVRGRGARAGGSLAVMLVLAGGLVVGMGPGFAPLRSATQPNEFEEFRRWLAEDGQAYDTITSSQRTAWVLRLFVNEPFGDPVWTGSIEGTNVARRFYEREAVDDGILVLSDQFFEPRNSHWREVTPAYLLDQPDDWSVVAATDGTKLVVFDVTGRADTPERPVSLQPWELRTTTGPTIEAVEVDGGSLRTSLGSGQRAVANVRVEQPLGVGDVLRVTTDIEATGDGNVVLFCFMTDETGRSIRVDALSLWGIGLDAGLVSSDASCAVPSGMVGEVRTSFSASVVGPVDLEVAGVVAEVVTPEDLRSAAR